MFSGRLWLILAFCLVCFTPVWAGDDYTFFEKSVRPILVERCYGCHSAGHKIKGGLRLDFREGWTHGGDSGPAIVPGKPEGSLMIKAVGYKDQDLKMPPKQKLRPEEVAVLQQWIADGAPDPRTDASLASAASTPAQKPDILDRGHHWWSFQPLRKPAIPLVKNQGWPHNAIDRFILARLEKSGLAPSPDAAPDVLCRRLYFDLAGLPPPLAALDDFGSAAQKDLGTASEHLAENLITSPQFGERWGRHWLDIVRFAESSGGGRTLPFKDAWRYRDYVIDSINANVPLDRFFTEQLAGDLLPYATPAERRKNLTATGFLVLGPTNYEEQDKQALRMDIIDEQIDTLGKAFLGMTLGCARCHDHKFDPVPQRDYYALAGILRSTRVLKDYKDNVAHWIDTPLPMDSPMESVLEAKEARLATLKKDLDTAKVDFKKAGVDSAIAKLQAGALDPAKLEGIVIDDSDAKQIGAWKHSRVFKTYIGDGYLTDDNRDKGAMTLTFTPKIVQAGRYEVRFAYTAANTRANNVPVVIFHADGENNVKVDETEPPPIDGRFVSLGTFRFEAGGEGYILISNTETQGFVTADAVQFIPVSESAPKNPVADATTGSTTSAPESKTAHKHSSGLSAHIKTLEAQMKELERSGPQRPEAMTVLDDETIEDCAIRIRGQVRSLGEVVPRGFLSMVPLPCQPPTGKESGRRELAAWMVNKDNPLTARVMANRVWLWLMGEGIVSTPDNFGLTGEKPSHSELLDYLATELIESGWNLRHLVTLIVESRTYQQTSIGTETAHDPQLGKNSPFLAHYALCQRTDPENRLYWRANRRRLEAECLRDAILTVSGQLDPAVGGSNIREAKAVDQNSSNAQALEYNYQYIDTRRSVYTPAFRNKRHDLFEAFDFADINQPIGKRNISTVAPQALFMLNHPFVMEQSRIAAERLSQAATAPSESDVTRIRKLYREVLGRLPSDRELQFSRDFVQVSAGEPDGDSRRLENWALFVQALFASVEFRYLR